MDGDIFEDVVEIGGKIVSNKWIEWIHLGVRNALGMERNMERIRLAAAEHCKVCTALDGCYFVENNSPELPLHPNCDCKKKKISVHKLLKGLDSRCDKKKFTEYVFGEKGKENGKYQLFSNWGFKIKDSEMLVEEFAIQGKERYSRGEYILKNRDDNGQRLSILIDLKVAKFYSGWMLEPEGKIRLLTPFGGRYDI